MQKYNEQFNEITAVAYPNKDKDDIQYNYNDYGDCIPQQPHRKGEAKTITRENKAKTTKVKKKGTKVKGNQDDQPHQPSPAYPPPPTSFPRPKRQMNIVLSHGNQQQRFTEQ
eukprot:5290908-Amphidinium_carterae.1